MFSRLILSRLFELAIVLFGVSLIVFLMIRLIPGDAVAIMLGANTEVTPDRIAELRGRRIAIGPEGSGTRVTRRVNYTAFGGFLLLQPFVGGAIRGESERILTAMKTWLERK